MANHNYLHCPVLKALYNFNTIEATKQEIISFSFKMFKERNK